MCTVLPLATTNETVLINAFIGDSRSACSISYLIDPLIYLWVPKAFDTKM